MKLNWCTQPLTQQLQSLWPDCSLEVVEQTDSTSTRLMQRIRQGHTTPTLLVAETQTAGRGRNGKAWTSQTGDSLTFSLCAPMPMDKVAGLSLAVGCAVANALDYAGQTLHLKWPNDIWYAAQPSRQWHKLAGILIETAGYNNLRYAVIGIGINIKPFPHPPHMPTVPLGSLQQLYPGKQPPWDAPSVLAGVAPEVARAVYNFSHEGLTPWAQTFQQRDLLEGNLLYTTNGLHGTGAGIDTQGNLRVRTLDGRIQTLYSGEVSVRPC